MAGKIECEHFWKESVQAPGECLADKRPDRVGKMVRVDDGCVLPGEAKKKEKRHKCCFHCSAMRSQGSDGLACPNICGTATNIKAAGMEPALKIDGELL